MSYLKTSFYGSLILGLSILLGFIFGDRVLIITVNLAYLYILFTLLPIIKHLIDLFKHKFNLKNICIIWCIKKFIEKFVKK